MTVTEVFNIVSMVEQLTAVVICRYILLFMPHSVYHCLARFLFHKDRTHVRWLLQNIYYLGYQLLSWCLVVTCLIMATQFSNRQIFVKPIAQVFVSPVTWFAVLLIVGGHFLWIRNRLREDAKIKNISKPV
jgi:hypothetical protein